MSPVRAPHEFIAEGDLLPPESVLPLHAEGEQLRAIFLSSIRTAKGLPKSPGSHQAASPPNPQSQIDNLKRL